MKIIYYYRNWLAGIISILLVLLFSSYGNRQVHPGLNYKMAKIFLSRNNKGEFSMPEFKKYIFYFEKTELTGQAVIKEGLFSDMDETAAGFSFGTNLSSEGKRTMTVAEWIAHGGMSADVPEVPASLRHFYDPTMKPGERYLKDITNAKILGSLQKYVLSNPHTDGIEWALGKPGDISEGVQDHKFTWERGKIWMSMALREKDIKKRDGYMAHAWRALGETLHMIADNGCPPHVRNDAHPSPFINNNKWFGNPDPYEELMDAIRRDNENEFNDLMNGKPDEVLKEQFIKSKRVYDIADAMAVYTNYNFVTNETISGVDKNGVNKQQITHPFYPYSSPLLHHMKYDENEHSYKTAAGIRQCTDRSYFLFFIPMTAEPYVDIQTVKAQASVLVPNLLEAGTQTIKLFIPKITVQINSLDETGIKGEIKHLTDEEYTTEIRYNGPVTITIRDNKFKVISKEEIIAINGKFESKDIKAEKEQKVVASIFFGGIGIESDEFKNGSSGIFGFYEGAFTRKGNESAILEAFKTDMIDKNSGISKESIESGLKWRQEEIRKFDSYFQSLVEKGLAIMKLTLYNAGTPPKPSAYIDDKNEVFTGMLLKKFDIDDKDEYLPDSKLEINDQGFTSVISTKSWPYNHITTQVFTGVVTGDEMTGSWSVSRDGIQLYSGEFKLRKIGSN